MGVGAGGGCGGGGVGGGFALLGACIRMHLSTLLQRLQRPAPKASVWGRTPVLGLSPKSSVGMACVYWANWVGIRLTATEVATGIVGYRI